MNFKSVRIYVKEISSLVVAIALLIFVSSIQKLPSIDSIQEKHKIDLSFTRYFNLGLSRLLSSAIWVQTLLEADIMQEPHKVGISWMFLRFKTISELEAHFYENYRFGGPYLSIIKNDLVGAEKIYELGLQYFPNDFHLLYNAGFNSYFEMKNYDKAIYLFEKALKAPEAKTVPYLFSLVSRLRIERNDSPQLVFNFMLHNYLTLQEGSFLKQKTRESLYSIKASIDLNCLNNGRTNCRTTDFDGKPYVLKNGKYVSQKKYDDFRYNK